jgi:uncharacterized membrane protein
VEFEYPLPEGIFISKEGIALSIKQGDMEIEEIIINNTRRKIIKVRIYALNITDYVQINETEFEIWGGDSKEIIIEFLIPEDLLPDIYLGKIVIEVDDDEFEIPVSLNVLSKTPDLEIKTKIKKEHQEADPGDEIQGIIEINNFQEQEAGATLEYGILDVNKNIILFHREQISIEDHLKLDKKLKIPSELKPGSYLFYAKVIYKDTVYSSSSWFYVKEKSPLPYVIAVCIIIGIIILYFLFRKKKKKPEKEKSNNKISKKKLEVSLSEHPDPESQKSLNPPL